MAVCEMVLVSQGTGGCEELGVGRRTRTLRGLLVVACIALVSIMIAGCSSGIDEASSLERLGDWDGALAVYMKILSEDPEDVSALSGAAVALMLLRRYDEALTYQERVIALDSEDVQTRIELGFNYLNHQGRAKDAVTVLSEAAVLEPSAKHLSFLAQAQEKAGDVTGAEESLRQAIAVNSGYVYAYRLLVSLLDAEGRHEDALGLVEQAQSLGLEVGLP